MPPPAITLLSVILLPPPRQSPIYHSAVSVLAPRQSGLYLWSDSEFLQTHSSYKHNVTDRIMSQISVEAEITPIQDSDLGALVVFLEKKNTWSSVSR